jgi:hypothetical protein
LKLHQRNIHQVLGKDLSKPSSFLLACSNEDRNGDVKGGTRTAWMLAKQLDVPCFNLRDKNKQEIYLFLKRFL